MRALRVVGFEDDGSGHPAVILEDPDRRERFRVPADERLRAAARGDVQRLGQPSMELESQLRPREIQARIRAGASVEQVAEVAGVPPQRIERFAYPVLLERSRIAELARNAHPVREDGPDIRTLGEVVEHAFGVRGQDYSQAEWDSWRGEDNKWVVTLSWRVGRSDITARWAYQPGSHGGTVTALDEHAVDLVDGHLRRPRRVGPMVELNGSDDPSAHSAEASGPTVPAPASGERTGADQPSRVQPDPDRPARDSRSDGPAPDPGRRATKTTTGSAARSRADGGDQAKRGGGRKGKPVMPSWEDVLLGVKRT